MNRTHLSVIMVALACLLTVPFPALAEQPEYSCTWINHFDTAKDLPDCDDDTDQTKAWLGSRGYAQRFVWSEDFVWDIDFGIRKLGL